MNRSSRIRSVSEALSGPLSGPGSTPSLVEGVLDEDLVRRHLKGDGAAFEALVRRWDRRVLELAQRLLGSAEDAEEVRQAVFVRVHGRAAGFEGRARFSTWLHTVVLNLCRDRLRTRRSDEELTRGVERAGSPDSPSTPLALTERSETSRRIARAVDALDETTREIVVLRHYQDLSFPQIAEVLGMPATTVKSRMLRGLVRLRGLLQELMP